ncbi:hypothetical protein C6361_03715 [Plantactinospora sp. BC1]|nr:hypothetical protein C6361_03715 [Plantactinospora sp. BC1]AVT41049.1 hypothetical protein C6W10_00260 [Plantactinospora sp. BB1]
MAVTVTIATVVLPTSPAAAAYADPLVATSKTNMGLTWHAESSAAIQALDNALPNVGVATVLDDANRTMTTCNSEELAALPIAPVATNKWCFDTADATDLNWSPQGITSSGDADDDGAWGAKRAILSGWSWGSGTRRNDARVAFIDYTNPAAPKYRWVYLVDPNSTGSDFSAAKTHIGGMIWFGDKLIVNAVGNGTVALRVFSMSHILQTTSTVSDIGKVSGGWAAYGYKYVMPQIGYYTYSSGACSMDSDTGTPCFSSLSLDRSTSPDSLVTAEYFSDQTKRGRLIRYPFGADYLLPTSATPSEAYASGVGNQQGVLSFNNRWYVVHSSFSLYGQIWGFTPGGGNGRSSTCTVDGEVKTTCWSLHPEAVTYWYSTGEVWSTTEWSRDNPTGPGGRVLYSVPLNSLP